MLSFFMRPQSQTPFWRCEARLQSRVTKSGYEALLQNKVTRRGPNRRLFSRECTLSLRQMRLLHAVHDQCRDHAEHS